MVISVSVLHVILRNYNIYKPPLLTESETICAPEPFRTFWRREKSHVPAGNQPNFLGRSACSLIIVPTTLSRLSRESNNLIMYKIFFYIPL
jgi:hypothetical protein